MVTLIVGLLAGFALVRLDTVRERAYDTAALADLHNAFDEIERYFNDHFEYPDDEDDLFNEGFALSEDISFLKFGLRDGSKPALARVHIHIAHAGSPHYYHYEYPGGDTRVCRRCAGSSLRRVSAHRAGFAPRSIRPPR